MSTEYEEEPQEDSKEEQAEYQKPEEFSFLQEKIKEEPPNKKKIAIKIGKTAGLGVVFGLVACMAFFALKPWAEEQFQTKPATVSIPEDEEEDATDEQGTETEGTEPTAPILTLENYKQINQACYEVASEAEKAVVEVIGVTADDEWLKNSYDMVNSVSGVIVADNGQELLVLAKSDITRNVQSLKVKLNDGNEYEAALKKQDTNLGIAIISIPRSSIKDASWAYIKTASLGNSNTLRRGEPVIALGKPFGYSGGYGYGIVSSTNHDIIIADAKYSLITTDISGTTSGTGILTNLNGEVVGFIDQSISEEDSKTLTTALGISNIKKEVELLSNGAGVPYIGIVGSEVTKEISEAQGIPQGIYVKEAEADSPAMKAGIQSGDIILKMGNDSISSIKGYYNTLLTHTTGESIKITGQRRGANGYVDIEYNVTIGSKE